MHKRTTTHDDSSRDKDDARSCRQTRTLGRPMIGIIRATVSAIMMPMILGTTGCSATIDDLLLNENRLDGGLNVGRNATETVSLSRKRRDWNVMSP
jgi:hypothetical protein